MATQTVSLVDFVEGRLERYRYTFTKQEALKATDLSDSAFHMAVSRLKKKSRLISPRQGFYVIVPPHYKRRGAPPASFFIDPMMSYLEEPYYVGVLTAGSVHGAAHHAAQEFQVVVSRQFTDVNVGRNQIVFIQNIHLDEIPVTRVNTETGEMTVSTPQVTALDLVYYDDRAGHLNNVATVLNGLAGKLEPDNLLSVAKKYHSRASVQRLGYIMEFLGHDRLVSPLANWLKKQKPSRVPLDTHGDRSKGDRIRPWEVIVNRTLEPD